MRSPTVLHYLVLTSSLLIACTSPSRDGGTAGTSGGAAGTSGGTAGDSGSTAGNSGSTAGTSGAAGNSGSTAGNSGSTAGNSGSTAGNSGSTAGNSGSTAGTSGSTAGTSGTAGRGGGGGSGTGGSGVPAGPFPSQACIDKANSLLAQMTVDEKAAQTVQAERAQITNAQVTQYGVGSIYSQGGSAPTTNSPAGWAAMINGYRSASRASRMKIPVIYGLDTVHGLGPVAGATVFPHNIGLGAAGDAALVEEVSRVVADESAGVGADFPFAPVVAVGRDERWGRTYETFGETVSLASTMGVAMVKGLQFPTGGTKISILGNAKHYLGDGGTAGGVNNGTTSGDENALRALHLEPYRAVVAARIGSIMLSYNSWQGTKMHVNKKMVTDVLKGELKFGGFVGTDYNGCFQAGVSGVSASLQACMDAGADMFMIFGGGAGSPQPVGSNSVLTYVAQLFTGGVLPMSRLDDAARRILAVKCEMGLFDTTGVIDTAATARVGSAEHRAVARRAVQKSLVVLKNDNNVLPLSKTATVALAGNSAQNTGNQCGGWTITWQGVTGDVIQGATSVRTAMEAAITTSRVVYSADGSNRTGAAVGVAVIGETPYSEGTGDKTDLTIPAAQAQVVMALKAAGLRTVVVLIAGRPMILDPILQYADAIVMAWLPGSEGAGITDVLFGDVKPSGKLPVTWPRTMQQIPINMGDATYDPLYPYGHGLTW